MKKKRKIKTELKCKALIGKTKFNTIKNNLKFHSSIIDIVKNLGIMILIE